jgi:hypothetical protein
MKNRTEEQRLRQNQLQKEYRERNVEKVKQYRVEYRKKNLEEIKAKDKIYRERLKLSNPIEISKNRIKLKIPLFKILDVLQIHKTHYLNKKEVVNWNENDLAEFNKLAS